MDKNRNSGTNGMGGLNPDWRPSTIGALSRALSNGWKSPAMLAEENAENNMFQNTPDNRNAFTPAVLTAANTQEEWRFGQPSDLRKLVQRLQTGETEEASKVQSFELAHAQKPVKKNPPLTHKQNFSSGIDSNKKQRSKLNDELEEIMHSRSYKIMSSDLLDVVNKYREIKSLYRNAPKAVLKNLITNVFTYIPKKAIKATWEFASNPNSLPNLKSLEQDYLSWQYEDIRPGKDNKPENRSHLYRYYTHIPWEIFENYDKRMPDVNLDEKLKDWIHDRPELWATAMLRRGDWTKEDIDLLTELIDLTAGLTF